MGKKFDVIMIMYFYDPQKEAVYLLSFFHGEVRVQVSCSLINQYSTVK